MSGDAVIAWLLEGDPAIRWQVRRDLLDEPYERDRKQVLRSGWGAALLARRKPDGHWGRGVYTPKWVSTTYTLLEWRSLGPPPGHRALLKSCSLLLDLGLHSDGGINFWGIKRSETCVTGMVLSFSAALGLRDPRLSTLAAHLLNAQMPDGGWNCQRYRGATHASVHTTISVLEALLDYERAGPPDAAALREAQQRGREFLLAHRLFRSHRTGKVFDSRMTRFTFPPRWHYDVLRGLDYFQAAGAAPDPRLDPAIELLLKRRLPDGRWRLAAHWPGRMHFQYEAPGRPSRWNTLRALRVLRRLPMPDC